MAWAAATVSQETRFSLPSRCSAMTRIMSAMFSQRSSASLEDFACRLPLRLCLGHARNATSNSLSFLLHIPKGDQQQAQQHVYAKDSAHQRASGIDVPLHKKTPAGRCDQHNESGYDQGGTGFMFGYREVVPAFGIVFHSLHGLPPLEKTAPGVPFAPSRLDLDHAHLVA